MEAHCERCDETVEGIHRPPRLRVIARGYLLIAIPIVPIFPIMASDYVVSLPLLMFYMLGMGPVLAIIREPATCTECGAFLPASSLVPPRRAAPSRRGTPGSR